jgi:hypothetical protein
MSQGIWFSVCPRGTSTSIVLDVSCVVKLSQCTRIELAQRRHAPQFCFRSIRARGTSLPHHHRTAALLWNPCRSASIACYGRRTQHTPEDQGRIIGGSSLRNSSAVFAHPHPAAFMVCDDRGTICFPGMSCDSTKAPTSTPSSVAHCRQSKSAVRSNGDAWFGA